MSFHRARSLAQDAPLVGRELEVEALCAGLRLALRGKPNLALVCGEAGVGKTRLLREFAALARRLDVRVIQGCASEDSPVSYLPFMGVFDACSNAGSGLEQASGAATIFEALRGSGPQGGSMAPASVDAGEHERLRLFLTITRQVLALARREPTLLVLDDLHWADAPSLTLLAQLGFAAADAAEVERLPLMIVALHRPVEVGHRLGHVLQRLRREPIVSSVELEGLPAAETSTLLRQLAVGPVSSQLVETVQRITHGYPLFVQELVHQLRANDLLERVDGYLTVKAPPVGVTLPHDVRTAVAARLAALDDAALRVLELAALLGDTFSPEQLARAAGLSLESVLALLEAAVEQQLLVPEATAFRFRHPLLRQALAERPSATRQELMHLRIARAQQAAGPETGATSAEIARHLIAARSRANPEERVRYARRGADHAFSICSWAEAARLYAHAAEAGAESGVLSPSGVGELHLLAGLSHHHDFDFGPCLRQYERAMAAFREAGELVWQAHTLRHQTRARYNTAKTTYGDRLDTSTHELVLAQLGDEQPLARGFLLEVMAIVHWTARDAPAAEALAARALAIGEQLGDDRLRHHASFALGLAQFQSGRLLDALQTYSDSLEQARRTQDPWIQIPPLQRLAVIQQALGHFEEAERLGAQARALTGQTYFGAEASFVLSNLATTALARGNFRAVEEYAREAVALSHRTRYPWGAMIALLALASARAQLGCFDDARHAIDVLATPGEVFDEPGESIQYLVTAWRDLLALQAAPTLRHDEIRQRLPLLVELLAVSPLDANAAVVVCVIVEIAVALRVPDACGDVQRRLVTLARYGMRLTSGGVFSLQRVLGQIAALTGDDAAALAHLEVAQRETEEAGARPELARCLLDRARLLRASHDHAQVARCLGDARRAAALFAELGMQPLLAQALQLVAAAGGAEPAPASPPDRELSPRDIELLQRLARGKSHGEIAADLLLPPKSVSKLTEQLFAKIDVPGAALASAYALAHGIVGPVSTPLAGPLVLMVTDMVGFTSFVERVGDLRARSVIHVHNRVIRFQLSRHRGTEVTHTGDGLMASFVSADDAVACAAEIMRELARHDQEHPDSPIRVRIGLNAGTVLPEEDRLFGAALNAAVRVCTQASAGQILLSDSVLPMTSLRSTRRLRPLGPVALKGFSEPVVLHELSWDVPAEAAQTAPLRP